MPENNDAQEMDVLLGFREVAVGQEVIKVSEFGLMQGLRLATAITPLVADISEQLSDYKEIDDVSEYVGILLALFGKHEAITRLLITEATGKPESWADKVGNDGEELLLTLWVVNRDFFLRRARIVLQSKKRLQAQAATT